MATEILYTSGGDPKVLIGKTCEPIYLRLRLTHTAGAERRANGLLPHLKIVPLAQFNPMGDPYGQTEVGSSAPVLCNAQSVYLPRECAISVNGGGGGATYRVTWVAYPSLPPQIWYHEIEYELNAAATATADIPVGATHLKALDACSVDFTAAGLTETKVFAAGEEWPLGFFGGVVGATMTIAAGKHYLSAQYRNLTGILPSYTAHTHDRDVLTGRGRPWER